MKPSRKILTCALLFVGLVLVNYLASSLPWRLDATAEHIYTLSPGTKSLLGGIEEPLTLDLYCSKDATGQFIEYKNYAERVKEMLRQYARAAHGKIVLNVIDPEPDTPEEERATTAGIEAQTPPNGAEPFYFGLVATQADQQKAIPALAPQREQFLEYDLSELVYGVQQIDKKKLGLITSLPLQGTPGNPMMGQPGQEGQYVTTAWEDTFSILPVDAAATELPANLDALAVIHPENLAPRLQFAIDQFLLSGKPVFVAVDPSSQYFKRQGGGQMAMMQGPPPNVASDLPVLFGGWGVSYNPLKVVGDNSSALEAQGQGGAAVRYPVWLGLDKDDFNAQSPPTAQLNTLWFVEAGSLALKPGSPLTFTPLVQTTAQGGELDAAALQFAQPDDIARQIKPSGAKTIAALVTGKFSTAFPGGAPKDAPPADGAKPAAPAPAASPALAESKTSSTLLVVADTDWLFDDYSLRKFNYLGQTAAEPLNDNLSFASNALDFLSGSQSLLSIRGKGTSLRPFKVVRAMEAEAGAKYREKLTALEAELTQVQAKLTELQGKKTKGNQLVATPEMTKDIEDFQKQDAKLRGERRQIRLVLREGIDRLENRLLALNLLVAPLLVCGFGLFYRSRRK
jgi:ABC-type uncharacterized transport system involved in gliding motility auxiliary subunit